MSESPALSSAPVTRNREHITRDPRRNHQEQLDLFGEESAEQFGLSCEYMREKKKRGKASRKDLAERAAAQAAAVTSNPHDVSDAKESSHSPVTDERSDHLLDSTKSDSMSTTSLTAIHDHGLGDNAAIDPEFHHGQSASSTPGPYGDIPDHHHLQHPIQITSDGLNGGRPMQMSGYANMSTSYDRQSLASDDMMGGGQGYTTSHAHQSHMNPYPDMAFGMVSQSPTEFHNTGNFRMSASPIGGYHPIGAAASPAWAMPISSPPSQYQPPMHGSDFGHNALRYPVLQPLLPHLSTIMPVRLACDLIDFYFASSSPTAFHPMSPYVLASVFRKRAICHPTRPRKCRPALLASMLWVAAQNSDAPLLTSVPTTRGKICHKLLELTISLLKPLMHGSSAPPSSHSDNTPGSAVTVLHPLGAPLGSIDAALSGQSGPPGGSRQLDDLVTYIHLATVVSASEYKGSSLRWWNVAWSLARELKLGRELPSGEPRSGFDQHDMDTDGVDEHDRLRNTPGHVTEEGREERRRIWWLVYIVDRHLALCYNRPLFLLDVECEGLKQPLDDVAWQNGDFPAHPAGSDARSSKQDGDMTDMLPEGEDGVRHSRSLLPFEFRGHSIYGFFLPLMMILGEIVDLHHARNHPRFGTAFRDSTKWSAHVSEIRGHLKTYEESLKRFETRNSSQNNDGTRGESSGLKGYVEAHRGAESNGSPSVHSVHTSSSRITEAEAYARTISAYGTYIMHVLHLLLEGKWDPISLLEDEDMWTSSPEFATASNHVVAAAEALEHILEYDTSLELLPFFLGVYLLQGSFLLLVVTDKLQGEASPNVVRACETVLRAHDAFAVTFSTDYQRQMSKVMRGALALARGCVPDDLGEQLQRRRELLSLYRWTGDGTGLAF
ncbi:hypothetical protein E4U42_001914 [Claviceps africana]|uniref:Xylanolytic transcriptional activator regulatory domain-containing protein n=1 Tax=Claviceps africana TaxID=83212 RepID=A0A8K0NHT9_9HYPO|nr:hypothetical protein E4U42_001914 [Claviceps africana]